MAKNKLYYKDGDDINHRSTQAKKLKELADLIRSGDYQLALLPFPRDEYPHKESHEGCDYKKTDNLRVVEKRICRCFYYYNKNIHNEKCASCKFMFKKANVGQISIENYEMPTLFRMDGVGGIDWILGDGKELLATEVKPPDSQETLVRMIAEILTYTIGKNLRPAICFFETCHKKAGLSKQCLDYLKYKNNPDFQYIVQATGLKILYVTFNDCSFVIHDVEKEPLN